MNGVSPVSQEVHTWERYGAVVVAGGVPVLVDGAGSGAVVVTGGVSVGVVSGVVVAVLVSVGVVAAVVAGAVTIPVSRGVDTNHTTAAKRAMTAATIK